MFICPNALSGQEIRKLFPNEIFRSVWIKLLPHAGVEPNELNKPNVLHYTTAKSTIRPCPQLG